MENHFDERVALAHMRGWLDGAPLPPVNYRDLKVGSTEAERLHALELLRLSQLGRPELQRRRRKAEMEIGDLHSRIAKLGTLIKWMERKDYAFEGCPANLLPRFMDSFLANGFDAKEPDTERAWLENCLEGIQAFVVERDWAALFAGAEGFAEGEIRLPADHSAFMFQASGRKVIAFLDGNEYLLAAEADDRGWFGICRSALNLAAPALTSPELNQVLWRQIRAICIMLDAEVAEREVLRAPHFSTKNREPLPPEFYDYNVVSLRRSAHAHIDGTETGKHRRLHFRRGHWRHYENFKTWVRWCLAGDPALGWIDKEYRL